MCALSTPECFPSTSKEYLKKRYGKEESKALQIEMEMRTMGAILWYNRVFRVRQINALVGLGSAKIWRLASDLLERNLLTRRKGNSHGNLYKILDAERLENYWFNLQYELNRFR